MKNTQRRSGGRSAESGAPGFLRRLLDSLGGFGGGQLVPVPIPAPAQGPFRTRFRYDQDEGSQIHLVFGRRKEEPADSTEEPLPDEQASAEDDPAAPVAEGAETTAASAPEGGEMDTSAVLSPAPEPDFTDQLPPIPSALSDDDEDDSEAGIVPSSGESPVEASWSNPSSYSEPAEPSPFSYEPPDQPDLPAWTPSPISRSGFPSFIPEGTESETPMSPWSGGLEPDPVNFQPESAQQVGEGDESLAWPTASDDPKPVWAAPESDSAVEAAFPVTSVSEAASQAMLAPEAEPEPEAIPVMDEYATETELVSDDSSAAVEEEPSEMLSAEEEADLEPYELEQIPEAVAVSESSWAVATSEPESTRMLEPRHDEFSHHLGAAALVADARAFPLPEGEILFRNLRSGFTDPARLLRHLAGEGHTGVMHVSSQDDRNSYIVLVDGYVVAVASDTQGRLTTTNRVSFPNFPNSQDVLNVITYPREIARGLGLLLHAPVHFRGLGAMFVNLDGLRSYLSKHSASGGMVVQSDTGTGVALFDDGRLVGAYSGSALPESDLSPLRELIKDLDAEIDVRFGGPQALDPIPLDTLLAGYPL